MKSTVFDAIPDSYITDEDFSDIWTQMQRGQSFRGYKLPDGFLFFQNRLCIPKTSLRLQLINDTHSGGLAGHYGRDKVVS